MAISATYTRGYSCSGQSFSVSGTPITSDAAVSWNVSLAAAKTGTLTTRTDDNTGVLTMTGGHGITTGQRLDVYWTLSGVYYCRYGMTVGTVATNSVPIDGGAGDVLPVVSTAITAQVPVTESVVVTGDDVVAFAVSFAGGGTAVFATSGDATIAVVARTPTNTNYVYSSSDGGTNPLAGGSVAKVFLSQGGIVANISAGVVQYD